MSVARGFTLLECVIALAILAIAMTSALRAVGNTAQSSAALRERTLAGWIAQNRFAELRMSGAWPAVGRHDGSAAQAGRTYVWHEDVQPTPNPLFRRVEVHVFDDAGLTPLAQLTGFVVRPLR